MAEDAPVNLVDDCRFDERMNNTLWRLHRKKESAYYTSIGISAAMQLILGMLSVDIGFQITGNQLVITTIAPVRKIEQHLTFNANTTMADGMNPLVPGREIIKVERQKRQCRWRGTFVHPDYEQKGVPLIEEGTWRLIRNGTMLEVRRRSNWGDDDGILGKWIFKQLQ